jgi:hypothetical protein
LVSASVTDSAAPNSGISLASLGERHLYRFDQRRAEMANDIPTWSPEEPFDYLDVVRRLFEVFLPFLAQVTVLPALEAV